MEKTGSEEKLDKISTKEAIPLSESIITQPSQSNFETVRKLRSTEIEKIQSKTALPREGILRTDSRMSRFGSLLPRLPIPQVILLWVRSKKFEGSHLKKAQFSQDFK